MSVGAWQDIWVPLTSGNLIQTTTQSAEDVQSLTEMDEWNPGPAGISLCLKAQWDLHSTVTLYGALSAPLHRSICKRSWAFSVDGLLGGPSIRSEYHPADSILQRCYFLQQLTQWWWGCKWLWNECSLQSYPRGKMVRRCSTSSFRFEERF